MREEYESIRSKTSKSDKSKTPTPTRNPAPKRSRSTMESETVPEAAPFEDAHLAAESPRADQNLFELPMSPNFDGFESSEFWALGPEDTAGYFPTVPGQIDGSAGLLGFDPSTSTSVEQPTTHPEDPVGYFSMVTGQTDESDPSSSTLVEPPTKRRRVEPDILSDADPFYQPAPEAQRPAYRLDVGLFYRRLSEASLLYQKLVATFRNLEVPPIDVDLSVDANFDALLDGVTSCIRNWDKLSLVYNPMIESLSQETAKARASGINLWYNVATGECSLDY